MALTIKDTLSVMVDGNKGAVKASAKRRAGKLLNDRLVGIVAPRLPLMVRGYADTELGKAMLANTLAAVIVHFGYNNEKLLIASDAMVVAAMDDLIGSFDIEGMVDSLIDGVNLNGFKETADDVRGATASVLRKAADVTDNDEGVA